MPAGNIWRICAKEINVYYSLPLESKIVSDLTYVLEYLHNPRCIDALLVSSTILFYAGVM